MDLQSLIANAKDMFSSKSATPVANTSGGSDPNDETIDLKDSKGIKGGKYYKKNIQGLIKAAKVVGVDPHQLLALGWQESNLGGSEQDVRETKEKEAKLSGIKTEKGRTWHDRSKMNIGQVNGIDNPQELAELATKTGISNEYLAPALALRDKLKYAKHLGFNDEAMALQAYNGYGVIPAQKDANGNVVPTKYYGQNVPAEGLNMRQNPLYGKRLLELKSDLSKNKYINSLIDENTDLPVPTATSVIAKR